MTLDEAFVAAGGGAPSHAVNGRRWVDLSGVGEPQTLQYSVIEDPETWTVIDHYQVSVTSSATCTVTSSCSRRGQPMFRVVEDDEDEGFPCPFRTDGRVNHWYEKWVARIEGRGG